MRDEETGTELVEVEVLDAGTALMSLDRAAIDVQIATAHQYPRSITRALREAQELACIDVETAQGMTYTLPRDGKKISGPSVRLAEVMAYSWGNLRVETNIEAIDEKHVTCVGTCFDLEKNVAVRTRVKRRITTSSGKRYSEDMIVTTANAASSIARRNAIFSVIPLSYAKQIQEKAKKAALGKGTIKEQRASALKVFKDLGATEAQVFGYLGVRGADDITIDHLFDLMGLKTAIETGETSLSSAFSGGTEPSAGLEKLKERQRAAEVEVEVMDGSLPMDLS